VTVTVFNEPVHPCAPIVSEREGFYSRDAANVTASATVVVGSVLGRSANVALVTAAPTAAAGNTGDGVITMDPTAPVRGDVLDGVYQVEFITAGAAAEYNVLDPDGKIVGTGAVGGTFVGPLKFAIADDAAHHYAAGDRILITVAVPLNAYVYEPLNLAAGVTDGSNVAAAIALYPLVLQPGQSGPVTGQITILVREAEFRLSDISLPAGITAPQTAEVLVQLRKRGLIAR
jgi:hypothetical protein